MGNQFIMPKQVFYGENALKDAADVIATLGKKALVVTDPMMMKLGTAQMVTDLLDEKGVHYAIYSNITGGPTDKMIEAGLQQAAAQLTIISVRLLPLLLRLWLLFLLLRAPVLKQRSLQLLLIRKKTLKCSLKVLY